MDREKIVKEYRDLLDWPLLKKYVKFLERAERGEWTCPLCSKPLEQIGKGTYRWVCGCYPPNLKLNVGGNNGNDFQ